LIDAMRFAFLALLFALAPAVQAGEGARVPAGELQAAAAAEIQAAVERQGIAATATPVGRLDDLSLATDAPFELRAVPLPAKWLRSRVAVPVEVHSGGRRVSTVTTWFAVTAPTPAPVYATAYPRGTDAASMRVVDGTADLARTRGESPTTVDAVAGLQLRRAVLAGQPLLANDFMSKPAIRAQQVVRIESVQGSIRLATTGRALADAQVGDLVAVLPNQAERPVRARVISPEAVSIEN
jgi:flagella basal body P-ring formation protein FlgA